MTARMKSWSLTKHKKGDSTDSCLILANKTSVPRHNSVDELQHNSNKSEIVVVNNKIMPPNISQQLNVELCAVARAGDLKKLKKLLKKKTDSVNDYDSQKQTPLHIACSIGNFKMITQLLKLGAEVDAVDCNQWTPLHCCASNGFLDICK